MYQACTIRGSGGFSKVNDPKTTSGSIACTKGTAWVRLRDVATAAQSGANTDVVNPDGGSFTDLWIALSEGVTIPFGQEAIRSHAHANSVLDPVAQIDVFAIDEDTEIIINQH